MRTTKTTRPTRSIKSLINTSIAIGIIGIGIIGSSQAQAAAYSERQCTITDILRVDSDKSDNYASEKTLKRFNENVTFVVTAGKSSYFAAYNKAEEEIIYFEMNSPNYKETKNGSVYTQTSDNQAIRIYTPKNPLTSQTSQVTFKDKKENVLFLECVL
jgi:hypothetical protein